MTRTFTSPSTPLTPNPHASILANAYRFAVNPLGTQQDALITDEGRDVNLSWDAPWISAGRIDETGWTVEIAIPLTTLRFTEGTDTWGLNFARIIRRKNEENLWSSWQRSFGLERVSQAGELFGVEEIKRRRLLEVKPYASGGWREGVPLIGERGSMPECKPKRDWKSQRLESRRL